MKCILSPLNITIRCLRLSAHLKKSQMTTISKVK